MLMTCRLFVFRHAETYDNARGIFSGWRDSELTSNGLLQAQEIAEQLSKFKISYGFTSHLKRARKTLEMVLRGRSSVEVIVDDRLIERCYGLFQGRSKIQVAKENPKAYARIHRDYDIVPPEGESLYMVENRVISFIEQLKKFSKQNPGNFAISCHNNSIRPFRRIFEELSRAQMCELESPQSCALIYDIRHDDSDDIDHREGIAKFGWDGKVISKKIRLATDPQNVLHIYY